MLQRASNHARHGSHCLQYNCTATVALRKKRIRKEPHELDKAVSKSVTKACRLSMWHDFSGDHNMICRELRPQLLKSPVQATQTFDSVPKTLNKSTPHRCNRTLSSLWQAFPSPLCTSCFSPAINGISPTGADSKKPDI
jgi:hypothetical protein